MQDEDPTMNEPPGNVSRCSRLAERYRLALAGRAFVELRLSDESCWQLDLLELGAGGLCFGLDQGCPTLQTGSRIEDVVLHVGEARVAGSVRIAHVTEEFSVGTICGATFEPATEDDERELQALIDRLEAGRQRIR